MDPEHTWTNAAAVNWALKVIYNPVWCGVGAAERVGGQVVINGSTLHDVEASIRLLNPKISHTELQVFLELIISVETYFKAIPVPLLVLLAVL